MTRIPQIGPGWAVLGATELVVPQGPGMFVCVWGAHSYYSFASLSAFGSVTVTVPSK